MTALFFFSPTPN